MRLHVCEAHHDDIDERHENCASAVLTISKPEPIAALIVIAKASRHAINARKCRNGIKEFSRFCVSADGEYERGEAEASSRRVVSLLYSPEGAGPCYRRRT